MNFDISHLLDRWDYRAGEVMVRRIKGRDGTAKLQLRVDLGILQMNAEGRPDGKKPFGFASYYDYLLRRLDAHVLEKSNDEDFKLNAEQCTRLHLEALQFHHRYICLLQLHDFEGVEKDALRNLDVFAFAARYADDAELAWSLLQFQPQSLMILTRARATPWLRKRHYARAVTEIETGIQMLSDFYEENNRQDLRDQSVEMESLQHWLDEVRQAVAKGRKSSPRGTQRERLERALAEAVAKEDYEEAARVRDRLRKLPVRTPKQT